MGMLAWAGRGPRPRVPSVNRPDPNVGDWSGHAAGRAGDAHQLVDVGVALPVLDERLALRLDRQLHPVDELALRDDGHPGTPWAANHASVRSHASCAASGTYPSRRSQWNPWPAFG